MTVTNIRSAGANTIKVNTVANAPVKFVGTMGTPHTFTDPVTSETITIISEASAVDFFGSISGSDVIIDQIAAGYTDLGSKVGDIIVIKPITEGQNNLANVLGQAHNDDGSLKTSAIVYEPTIADFVQSGGIWSALTGLNAAMTALVAYQAGYRGTVAAVASRAFTLNKDTYVDVLRTTTGYTTTFSLVYTEVANGAAAPALAANSIRIAKVVTNGTTVTSVTQTGYDSLANPIYKQTPVLFQTLTNTYKMRVRNGGSFVVGGAASNKVIFSTIDYDTNNNYNPTTGEYTAPVSGYYRLHGHLRMDSSMASGLQMIFVVNGTSWKNAVNYISGAEQTVLSGSDLLYCPAGGKITLNYYNGSGNTTIFRDFDSAFIVEFAGL